MVIQSKSAERDVELLAKELEEKFNTRQIHEWAKDTEFMIRESKLKPEHFLILCAFSVESFGEKTLAELCSVLSVEGFLSMDIERWITAHIHAFEFYGGVTRIIVPDNLKTGVTKSSRTDPILNQSYQEMAEYYQTTIIPARVRKPRDKAGVEDNVEHISTWIIASLRNEKFFSLTELNKAIKEKLDVVNTKPFQKKKGNRQEAFLEEESFALIPLPHSPYEIASWAKTVVQPDYHVKIDNNYYSVPYDYIKCMVDVRVTRNIIEVFYKNIRIASHKKQISQLGISVRFLIIICLEIIGKYASFDKGFILEWGATTGPSTLLTIERILESYPTEKQGLKSTYALMKLADKYSIERIERACEIALSYTPRPKLKSIQTILKTGHDKLPLEETGNQMNTQNNVNAYGFTRGAAYYGGNHNDNRPLWICTITKLWHIRCIITNRQLW